MKLTHKNMEQIKHLLFCAHKYYGDIMRNADDEVAKAAFCGYQAGVTALGKVLGLSVNALGFYMHHEKEYLNQYILNMTADEFARVFGKETL